MKAPFVCALSTAYGDGSYHDQYGNRGIFWITRRRYLP